MKQVHRPASLVRMVLLPQSKVLLAALFVLQGSLEIEDGSRESVPRSPEDIPWKFSRINLDGWIKS